MAKTKGGLRSPMNGFEANPNHRTPSTSGTSEICETNINKGKSTKIQSPQLPFGVKPMNGGKATGGANKGN